MEEMAGDKTMEGRVSFLPLPRVFSFPSYCSPGYIISMQTGGDSTKLFTLLFSRINTVMERIERGRASESEKAGLILCMSLKQPPEVNSHIHTVAAILRKPCVAFISPLKCKCHFLLERCITISKDPKPKNQHTREKPQTY